MVMSFGFVGNDFDKDVLFNCSYAILVFYKHILEFLIMRLICNINFPQHILLFPSNLPLK